MHPRKIGYEDMDWINLAQDQITLTDFVVTISNSGSIKAAVLIYFHSLWEKMVL
jgi:uncharacterized protein with GYD domain